MKKVFPMTTSLVDKLYKNANYDMLLIMLRKLEKKK